MLTKCAINLTLLSSFKLSMKAWISFSFTVALAADNFNKLPVLSFAFAPNPNDAPC